ncbi:MAG TPA: hypothetical protein QF509_08225 [Rhodospirillales bacterium]|jgi:hypothetical protein|nr:hypothetical protein [Rhodospirillales bacterium]
MAYAKILMEHKRTGQIKQAPVGLSWTVLFFGICPTIFRRDWKGFVVMMVATVLSFGSSNIIFLFIYNKLSIKDLLLNGYRVKELTNITEDKLEKYLDVPASKFLLNPEQASTEDKEK